jgi:hypothetical protein
MNYSARASSVRVDFFRLNQVTGRPTKWYTTEAVDMNDFYNEELIHDALMKALVKHFGNKPRLSGMVAFCPEPYHRNGHPICVIVP